MKNHGRNNVRKHKEINNGWNYITLDILFKFVSLDKMKIISSETKDYLGRSGKGFNYFFEYQAHCKDKEKNQGITLIVSV